MNTNINILMAKTPLKMDRLFFQFTAAFALVSTFLLSSCNSDEEATFQAEKLISSTLLSSSSASTLQLTLSLSGIDVPIDAFQYDVDLYKITYATNYQGEQITASGLMAIPKTENQIDVISIQHGTIGSDSEAPSNLPLTDFFPFSLQAVASAGFVAIAPDYIGFGSSVDIVHPYYVEELSATSVVDNITAALAFADELSLNVDQQLFLAGYSQGGYVTMATHKYIEENDLTDMGLVASFPAAGGYDLKGFQELVFSLDTYHQPFYLAYISYGFQTALLFEQPLDILFNEPYASAIPSLFDGTNTGTQINGQLTNDLSALLTEEFLTGIDSNPDYDFISTALEENSLLDWAPSLPIYMFHGDADITVPYQTSVDTYNKMLENGTSVNTLSLTTLEGETHASGFTPYMESFLPILLDLR